MKRQILFALLVLFVTQIQIDAQPSFRESEIPAAVEKFAPRVNSIFNDMQYTELLTINLTTDIDLLIEQKKQDKYQPASIDFKTADGTPIHQQIKLKARGKSRRRICEFPPIKIKFKKDELESLGYHREFNEYKLVTHCTDDGQSEENLLKEFLAYKIYNELTDISFRVQLFKINYIDSRTQKVKYSKYGFLLEDNEELSHRLEGEMTKTYNLPTSSLDAYQFNLLAFFQYMIGNTDWDLSVMHNIKIITSATKTYPIIVPYDFDFAGIVNTKYARPNSTLPQMNVRDRVYQGLCLEDEELRNLVNLIQQRETEIANLIQQFDHLPRKERKDIIKYLKEFFDVLDNPLVLKEQVHWNCGVEE